MATIKMTLNQKLVRKVRDNDLKAKDLVEFILNYYRIDPHITFTFKVSDAGMYLTKNDVYSRLSLSQLYYEDRPIKSAYIDHNTYVLEVMV